VAGLASAHPGLQDRILQNYTRIENAHEVRKKTFNFLLCVEVQQTFSFPPSCWNHWKTVTDLKYAMEGLQKMDGEFAKSGEVVFGRRQQPEFPPKHNYYFLAHLQCFLKFACKFIPWYLHKSTN